MRCLETETKAGRACRHQADGCVQLNKQGSDAICLVTPVEYSKHHMSDSRGGGWHGGLDGGRGHRVSGDNLRPGMISDAVAARGDAFSGWYGDKCAGRDAKSNIGPGMIANAGAARGDAFGGWYGGKYAGHDAKDNLLGSGMVPDGAAARGLASEGWYGNGAPQRVANAPPQPIKLVDYARGAQPVYDALPKDCAQRVSAPPIDPIDAHNAHERAMAAMAQLDHGADAAPPRGRPRAPQPRALESSLLEPGSYPETLSAAHVEISSLRQEMRRLADRVARLEARFGAT